MALPPLGVRKGKLKRAQPGIKVTKIQCVTNTKGFGTSSAVDAWPEFDMVNSQPGRNYAS